MSMSAITLPAPAVNPSADVPRPPADGVILKREVSIPMADGTVLRADVYLPDRPGRFPAVLQRTPYPRPRAQAEAEFLALNGYAYVQQSVRGRFGSGGECIPGVDD